MSPILAIFKAVDLVLAGVEVGVKVHDKVKTWQRKRRLVAQIKKGKKK